MTPFSERLGAYVGEVGATEAVAVLQAHLFKPAALFVTCGDEVVLATDGPLLWDDSAPADQFSVGGIEYAGSGAVQVGEASSLFVVPQRCLVERYTEGLRVLLGERSAVVVLLMDDARHELPGTAEGE